MSRPLGIDLGTTNSVVAYCDETGLPSVIRNSEGEVVTPSVVAFDESQPEPLVGEQARQTFGYGFCPGAELFKRAMGQPVVMLEHNGEQYTPEMLSAIVLRRLVDEAELVLGERPTEAVVTVPAYFENAEREATLEAVRLAGLECLQLINEPTAAAISFQVNEFSGGSRVLVYDLGGGTFDVTILDAGTDSQVLASMGDPRLGGADWDDALMEIVRDRVAGEIDPEAFDQTEFLAQLRRDAESVKKRLSQMQKSRVAVGYGGTTVSVEITREEFEEATRGLLERTIDLTNEALEAASVAASQIDHVLLIGGSTRMPAVVEVLKERFGKEPRKTLNPDEAVALGAASKAYGMVFGGDLVTSRSSSDGDGGLVRMTDVTNHSLGMIAISEDGSEYVNEIMIARSTQLPADQSKDFEHAFDASRDDGLEVYVTQGEGEEPSGVNYLGRYLLDGLPGVPDRTPVIIEVGFQYDRSSVVGVRARKAGDSDWTDLRRDELPYDVPERFEGVPPKSQSAGPLDVLLFFDVSYSMEGSPIQKAREAADAFLKEMDLQHTRLGVGVVANNSKVLLEPTSDPVAIGNAISQIKCNAANVGGGNAGHPFDDIKRVLGGTTSSRFAVVLADGIWSDQDVAEKAAKKCLDSQIEIVAVGFGQANEEFLNKISTSRDLSTMTTEGELTTEFTSIARKVSERSGLVS